jgi:ABC-2 type transport system permease protein
MRRFLALFRKEFLQLRRDPGSLRLLFILPVMQTLILGYAMTRDVRNIPLAVVDLDHSPQSASLSRRLETNRRFAFQGHLQSLEAARQELLAGRILVAVAIPVGFEASVEQSMRDQEGPERSIGVQVVVDGQDAATAATASGYASAIVSQWGTETLSREMVGQGLDARSLQPFDARDRILFDPELEYSWYMVPGMIVLLVTMSGALLTAFSIVRERESGTLEQLLVTPVRPVQILLGKALPYWILSQVVFVLALTVTGLWYGVPLANASVPGLALGIALYCLTSVSLGVLISTVVGSQQQALFLIWFCLIFFILTSGFMLPFESMPGWMQALTEVNSVRHFLFMVRALVLRGASPLSLLPEYLKLAGLGSGLFLAAVALFRRKAA